MTDGGGDCAADGLRDCIGLKKFLSDGYDDYILSIDGRMFCFFVRISSISLFF